MHQIGRLEQELQERFEGHPDAEILRSLPDSDSPRSRENLRESGELGATRAGGRHGARSTRPEDHRLFSLAKSLPNPLLGIYGRR